MSTVILFQSTDGQTARICEYINHQLLSKAEIINLSEQPNFDISNYQIIIVGASIRYGKHNKIAVDFLTANIENFKNKKTAFFSVNLVARKEGKNTPETNNYVKKLLQKLNWKPDLCGVFAGKLNYPIYGFFDRQIIRFIMWMTSGPTELTCVQEFTNWQSVDEFCSRISDWQATNNA